LQAVAVCLAVAALLVGQLLNMPENREPLKIHFREATAQEERAYERRQLADVMEALREGQERK